MRKPKFHPAVDAVLSHAARAALTPVLTLGFANAMGAARGLARAYCQLDRKHVERAKANLRDAYPTWDQPQVDRVAVACHEHLFQLGVEFAYAPRLLHEGSVSRHISFANVGSTISTLLGRGPVLLITGHIGNWELVGSAITLLGVPMAAVYRPLDLRGLDAWVKRSRESHGLYLLSKFGAARAVPAALEAGVPVGLVADQSGGDRGVFTPYFGRLTSTYKMIGLAAMRFNATIVCGVARRVGVGEAPGSAAWVGSASEATQRALLDEPAQQLRYSIEVHDHFGPSDWQAQPDALYYITARYRKAMESMVRSAPEQYFWMHRIWRSRPAHERLDKPFPPALREKMLALPWMTQSDVDAVVDRSERDRAEVRAGTSRIAR